MTDSKPAPNPRGVEFDALLVDARAQDEGDWVSHPDYEGLEIKTRSLAAAAYRDEVARQVRAASRGFRPGEPLPAATIDRINREALIKCCVLDWRGLVKDGAPVPYDPEILRDPNRKPLLDLCFWAARYVGETAQAQLEADAKN